VIDKKLKNKHHTNDLGHPVRSQMALYEYYKNQLVLVGEETND
jgi:hypothetical protein